MVFRVIYWHGRRSRSVTKIICATQRQCNFINIFCILPCPYQLTQACRSRRRPKAVCLIKRRNKKFKHWRPLKTAVCSDNMKSIEIPTFLVAFIQEVEVDHWRRSLRLPWRSWTGHLHQQTMKTLVWSLFSALIIYNISEIRSQDSPWWPDQCDSRWKYKCGDICLQPR